MNLIELIKRIDSGAYNLIPTPNGWEFEFTDLTKIVDDHIIIDSILENEKLEILDVVSKKEDETKCNLATELDELSELSIIISKENFKDFTLQINNLSANEVHVILILEKSKFTNFIYYELDPQKKNVIIYPFLDSEIVNGWLYITNKMKNIHFEVDEDIGDRLLYMQESSTILIDKFYLPEMFYFHSDNYNKLPNSFQIAFAINFLASISSFSRNINSSYSFTFKGYKSNTFELGFGDITKNLKVTCYEGLLELYKWIFAELRIADLRLSIVRNLLTLDVQDLDQFFKRLMNSPKLLQSAKHHSELIIRGNIKEHFEYYERITKYVQNTQETVNQQLNKLNDILRNVALPFFALIFSTFFKLENFGGLFYGIYLLVLIIYISYLRFVKLPDIVAVERQIIRVFIKHKNTLREKLKVIDKTIEKEEVKAPISKLNSMFNKNRRVVTIVLNTSFIISLVLLTIVIWSFVANYFSGKGLLA